MGAFLILVVVCIFAAIITFFKPFYILPVLVIASFIEPTNFFPELVEYKVSLVTGIVVLISWFLHIIFFQDFSSTKTRQVSLFYLFILWAIISSRVHADTSWEFFIAHCRAFLLYIFFLYMIKTRKQLWIILWTLLIFGAVAALYGFYCSRTGQGVMDRGAYRISGFFNNPNLYGEYLTLMIPLAIAFMFHKYSLKIKMFLVAILAFLFVGILLSFSRMCFIALIPAVILIITSFFNRSGKIPAIIMSIVFLLAVGYLMPGRAKYTMWSRVQTVTQSESAEDLDSGRAETTKAGLKMMLENPFFGVGLGGFRQAYIDVATRYPDIKLIINYAKDKENPQPLGPHNVIIETGSYFGIAGLCIFLAFVFLAFKDACLAERFYSDYPDSYLRIAAAYLKVSIILIMLMGMTTQVLTTKIFWVIMPLSAVIKRFLMEDKLMLLMKSEKVNLVHD